MADLTLARKVLEIEAKAILALVARLDDRFSAAVDLLSACRGRVILTGMGKSGIICRKIAATLASTRTPAFFLHPAEAIHGDLGVIQQDDVVVALSYSGETDEILRLVEAIKRLGGARLIAITGNPASTLAQAADVALDCSVADEPYPLNLSPTASTTAALAIGDALALTLLDEKGLGRDDVALLHPDGKTKRLKRVDTLMNAGDRCPVVRPETGMRDVLEEMSTKAFGMTCVADTGGVLLGVITDGDLRRHMKRATNLLALTAADVMTRTPVTMRRTTLAAEALNLMEQRKITSIVVVEDGSQQVAGVVHLHDLWGTEMF